MKDFPSRQENSMYHSSFQERRQTRLDNYRPISVLNVFSKVFERFILDQLTSYSKSVLSEFRSAYRKQYSCQHVLLRMIETWRKCLDENKIVGATLTDLLKAFNCLPHDLLVVKPGGGVLAILGLPGDVPFSWVYFLPKNSKAGYTFCPKILNWDINFEEKF